MRGKMLGAVVAVAMVAGGLGMPAQQTPQQEVKSTNAPAVTASNAASADATPVPTDQLLTSTVHEAWVASGRNEDKFFEMVKQCALMSAQKRGLTLPDSEAAGKAMGMAIKASARRDPDQLLYAVVDAAVRRTAGGTTKGAASTAH